MGVGRFLGVVFGLQLPRLESGDVRFAGYCARMVAMTRVLMGKEPSILHEPWKNTWAHPPASNVLGDTARSACGDQIFVPQVITQHD